MAKSNFKNFVVGFVLILRDGVKKQRAEAKIFIAKVRSRGAENGVYYVNGPDVLPPPLSKEKEAECIENLPFDEEAEIRHAFSKI